MKSALLLAAVFVIFFAARAYFHTNRNVFSIVAAVGALPAGRSVVVSILCLRARGASDKVRRMVLSVPGLDPARSGYDLYLTSYERAFPLSHAAAGNGTLVGFMEDGAADAGLCGEYLRQTLDKEGFPGCEVRIFHDPDAYVQALAQAAAVDAGDNAQGGTAGRTDLAQDRRVMELLYAISL